MTGTVSVMLKALGESYKCDRLMTSRKQIMASLFLAFAVFSRCSSAIGSAIVRRFTLITILSVSKRNGPQPLPSHT